MPTSITPSDGNIPVTPINPPETSHRSKELGTNALMHEIALVISQMMHQLHAINTAERRMQRKNEKEQEKTVKGKSDNVLYEAKIYVTATVLLGLSIIAQGAQQQLSQAIDRGVETYKKNYVEYDTVLKDGHINALNQDMQAATEEIRKLGQTINRMLEAANQTIGSIRGAIS